VNNKSLKKWLLFSQGIIILSIGIALTVWAKIWGVSPWDAFHLGLANHLNFNFGQIVQLVGAVAIVLGAILGVIPKLGTILNMFIVGWLANYLLVLLPNNSLGKFSFVSLIFFVLGIICYGIGTGLYIAADVGIGPRDSIMVGLNKKFGIKIARARTFTEITAVFLGFMLAGPIGIGTVLFSVTIGYVVEKTLNLYKTYSLTNNQGDN